MKVVRLKTEQECSPGLLDCNIEICNTSGDVCDKGMKCDCRMIMVMQHCCDRAVEI